MRIGWIIIMLLALCSCEGKSPSASTREIGATDPQPDPQQASAAGTIVLDQTQQQKGHVVVVAVRAKEVGASLSIPGRLTVNEDQTWHLGAIASGRIESITTRVGDSVQAGETLGLIHSHEVHEARAGYEEALTEVQRAHAAAEYAKQRRDRAQRLFDLKAGSRQDVETAESDLGNAHAAIQKAQSELEKERAHLTIFQVPIEEGANHGSEYEKGDDVPISAPASGLVLERYATVGSVVNGGEKLFTISDTSSLWMIASANEVDLSRLRMGQEVHIQIRAYPDREFTGRILKLGETLDPDTRTLQVRILVPNRAERLKPEMYATATLQESGQRLAVFVPEEAIQELNGVPVAFIRRAQNEFEARPIKTGRHIQSETEVLEGLNVGDAVVVQGSFLLKSQILKSTIKEN